MPQSTVTPSLLNAPIHCHSIHLTNYRQARANRNDLDQTALIPCTENNLHLHSPPRSSSIHPPARPLLRYQQVRHGGLRHQSLGLHRDVPHSRSRRFPLQHQVCPQGDGHSHGQRQAQGNAHTRRVTRHHHDICRRPRRCRPTSHYNIN